MSYSTRKELMLFLCISFMLTLQQSISFSQTQNSFPSMVLIPGGKFIMGDKQGEKDVQKEHEVILDSFYISKFEITFQQFKQFVYETGFLTNAEKFSRKTSINSTLNDKDAYMAGGTNGSQVFVGSEWKKNQGINWRIDENGFPVTKERNNYPVIHVCYDDAYRYCRWLSEKTGKQYRLPTEAEWEYVAKNGGKNIRYTWGAVSSDDSPRENIADETIFHNFNQLTIWKSYNDGYEFAAPVGSFPPNELGIYDLGGNVQEWCIDFYDPRYYKTKTQTNPRNGFESHNRVIRGGSWISSPLQVIVTYRNFKDALLSDSRTGFRVVMEIDKK